MKFNNGEFWINCKTVGDIVDALASLPRDLPVKKYPEETVDLVVYTTPGLFEDESSEHLCFEEGGFWSEQVEDEDDEGGITEEILGRAKW